MKIFGDDADCLIATGNLLKDAFHQYTESKLQEPVISHKGELS